MNGATVGLMFVSAFIVGCGPAPEKPIKGPASQISPGPKGVTLASPDPASEKLSLIRVLADPAAVDKRPVVVIGYLHLEFEGQRLCLHREDVENNILTNCVWIDVPQTGGVLALNERYVVVEGIIRAGSGGHLGSYQASLGEIRRIDPMPNRAEMNRLLRGAAQ